MTTAEAAEQARALWGVGSRGMIVTPPDPQAQPVYVLTSLGLSPYNDFLLPFIAYGYSWEEAFKAAQARNWICL